MKSFASKRCNSRFLTQFILSSALFCGSSSFAHASTTVLPATTVKPGCTNGPFGPFCPPTYAVNQGPPGSGSLVYTQSEVDGLLATRDSEISALRSDLENLRKQLLQLSPQQPPIH